MKNICKFLTIIAIASLPVIAFATVSSMPANNSSAIATVQESEGNKKDVVKDVGSEGKGRWNKDDEKMSDAVRDELKTFNEKKRAIRQECRKKQEDLRKTLSPEANKIIEARKERRSMSDEVSKK